MSKKLIGIIASFALVLSMVGANVASALTASDVAMLQAAGIISAAQAATLTASLTPSVSSSYTFTSDLKLGSRGDAVTALQQMLIAGGYMPSGYPFGYFGGLTKAAVIKYQLSKNITPAAGYFGSKSRAVANAAAGSVPGSVVSGPVVTGTDLVVSLAPTSPMSGAVVAGQAIADMVEYTFTNKSAAPAIVTNVTLQRGGVSNDAALTSVYLYNGVNRLTDAASISNGKISFNAPTGLFTVPAGSSMVVAVRADILAGSTYNGQIFVISLTDVAASIPDMGSYPVSGAQQTISSATLGTVAVASSSPSTTSIDPQNDYVMWQGTMSVGTNDVWMKSLALRQIGSVSAGDLNNFRFYVDGIQVGATLQSYDANGYLTFDLSASPLKVVTGSHIIKMVGDVIGGSTKNFSFSLRQASDINVVDSQLNVNVMPTAAQTFPLTSGVQSISAGTLTIVKATDSPAGSATLASNGVILAKFTLKAAGEAVKIEDLTVKYAGANAGALRNGALFANGSQIGSSAAISSTTAGTKFTLGSSLVVYPGSPVTLEVRADVAVASGVAIANGDAITISLLAGASNANLLKSLGYINTGAATGNTLTVMVGSLSLTKVTAYANQSIIAPQTAKLIGSYALTAGTTEDLLVNTITVNFLQTGASSSATSSITDLKVVAGIKEYQKSGAIASGDNTYSVNYTLAAGQTQIINVYATIASTIGAADAIVSGLKISGQTANSIQTVTAPAADYVVGQKVSITTGVLTPSAYAVAASSSVVAVPGSLVKAGSFKFVATGDTFTVDELTGFIPEAAIGNVASVVYKIGSSILNGSGTPIDGVSGIATSSVMFSVPSNGQVIVDAYLNLNKISSADGATSSSNVLFVLNGFEKITSTGVPTVVGGQALAGNTQYAYASVPTISNVNLPSTVITGGTQTLAKINISADAAGAIDWNFIKFSFVKPATLGLGAETGANNGWTLVDSAGTSIPGTFASSSDLATTSGLTTGWVTFTATAPQTISSSQVYSLKAAINGTPSTGQSISTNIAQGTAGHIQSATAALAASNASFVWSDLSFANHSATTPDWNNDVLIKNIPTDSQTLQY